jgi:hypothetical protein
VTNTLAYFTAVNRFLWDWSRLQQLGIKTCLRGLLSWLIKPFWPFLRVTRLGEILPFGQFFMALGEFFSRKNCPMI